MQRPLFVLLLLTCPIWAQAEKVVETGVVRAQGRPLPGATVTAVHGEQKVYGATDERGVYQLELEPGEWTLTVEMFGFGPETKTVHPGPGAPPVEWGLTMRAFPVRGGPGGRPGATGAGEADSSILSIPELAEAGPLGEPAAAGSDTMVVAGSQSQGIPPGLADSFGPGGFGEGFGPGGQSGSPGAQTSGANPFGDAAGAGGASSAAAARGGFGGAGGPGGGGPGGMRGGAMGGFGGPGGAGGRGGFGGRPGARGPGGPGMARTGAIGNRRMGNNRNGIRGMISFQARNSDWNARPFSLTGKTYDKPDQAQYRFSGTAGGMLPKLGTGTTVMLSYDLRLGKSAYNGAGTVPTALERAGDFSQSLTNTAVTVYDPLSGLPFAGNKIPESRLNPAAVSLLNYIPLPNTNSAVQNYQFTTGIPQNQQSLSARVNKPVSQKDRVGVNFQWQKRDSETAQLYGFTDESSGNGWSSELTWTRNLNPQWIQNLRLRYSLNRNSLVPYFAYTENVAGALGIQGTSQDPLNWGPPNLNFTNYGALNDGSPSSQRNMSLTMAAGWTVVKGKHTLAFGGDLTRAQINLLTDSNARGTFTFSGLATSQLVNGTPVADTGYDLADFLLGLPQSSSVRYGSSANYFRAWTPTAFIQEDWRARSNLTLSLGLRYELFGPMSEKYGRLANLDIAPYLTGVSLVTPDTTGAYSGNFPGALVNRDWNNFSPRLGLAWKASEKHRITVRAGYGWYYNGSIYQSIARQLASQPPFANTSNVTSSAENPLTLQNGFITTPAQNITNTYSIDRSYLVGYAQTWNVSVQKDLGRSFITEMSYIATKGTRLDMLRSPNRATPGSPLTAEERRLIPYAVNFTYDTSEANSIYHAAQARVSRRFSRGISFNALYTFSKSIDNASSIGGVGNSVAQDDQNRSAERGLSSFNRPHALTASFVYQSTVRDRSRGLLSTLGRNWNISGAWTAQSGQPFTARVQGNQSDTAGTGVVGSGRADATGLPVTDGNGYFNLGAFTAPPATRFGNSSRNAIPGPALFSLNASVGRSFALGDTRRRLEFRVEGNNVTNRVTITSLGTTVNASNYGQPLAAGAMRTINLILRFRF